MDQRILQKWTEYSDEVSKRMSPTEEREDVAPLVAAILTLADEILRIGGASRDKPRPRASARGGEPKAARMRGESRST